MICFYNHNNFLNLNINLNINLNKYHEKMFY